MTLQHPQGFECGSGIGTSFVCGEHSLLFFSTLILSSRSIRMLFGGMPFLQLFEGCVVDGKTLAFLGSGKMVAITNPATIEDVIFLEGRVEGHARFDIYWQALDVLLKNKTISLKEKG